MTMISKIGVVLLIGAAIAVPISAWSAPPAGASAEQAAENLVPSELRRQIDDLIAARDLALREMEAEYRSAPLDQRVALETEMTRVQLEFETEYLTLLLEYHRLSGNRQEEIRAAEMLEALSSQMRISRAAEPATGNTMTTGGTHDAR